MNINILHFPKSFICFWAILIFSYNVCYTKSFKGKVVSVLDGDTFILVDSVNVQHKIRLSGIDAPEKGQDYGAKSKDYLSKLIFAKTVRVIFSKYDRYGRILGLTIINNINVNEEMLNVGLAWAYMKYLDSTNSHYEGLMRKAKNATVGLWIMPSPVAPWDFRHR